MTLAGLLAKTLSHFYLFYDIFVGGEKMTIKEFFRRYAEAQTRLEVLKYQLKYLDCAKIQTTLTSEAKVQGGRISKRDDKIISDVYKKEQLEYQIAMLDFEVSRVEHAFKVFGEDGPYSARILKRKYINCHSLSKIANDLNLPYSRVKKILKDTEELLSCLLD